MSQHPMASENSETLEKSEENFDNFQRLDIVIKKVSYKIHCVVNYQISLRTHWV